MFNLITRHSISLAVRFIVAGLLEVDFADELEVTWPSAEAD